MITVDPILSFLSREHKYAVVGVSRDKKKFGRMAFDSLKKNGYDVIPVNPAVSEIDGCEVYPSLREIPADVKRVILFTPKARSIDVLKQAKEIGATHVWLQQSCDTPEAIDYGKSAGFQFIHGHCIFMINEPVNGFHKFHRSMKRFFGGFPKQ